MESDINICYEIERLINYGLSKNLIDFFGSFIARNSLYDLLRVKDTAVDEAPAQEAGDISEILNRILLYCYENGLVPDASVPQRDLMSSEIMGYLTPPHAEVIKKFKSELMSSPENATNYLYNLCFDVDYIKASRLKKRFVWHNDEPYGRLELSNDFQADERSPEERSKNAQDNGDYPKCFLCVENIGFTGNMRRLSGKNLRVVPVELSGEKSIMRFSPRQFYNEQFFLSGMEHKRRVVSGNTFEMMLEFVDRFPHYSLMMEADLDGLGNKSIEHCHFHGGRQRFPIQAAETYAKFTHEIFEGVEAAILSWPVSVMRVECDETSKLAEMLGLINKSWREYSDEELGIFAHTETDNQKIRHNSISVAVRKTAYGSFEADIALRNNRTTEECPLGVFSHAENKRNINKYDFGMTDIMGLAVYRGSFDTTLLHIISYIIKGKKYVMGEKPDLDEHIEWINSLVDKYGAVNDFSSAREIVLYEAAREFAKALECYGVFKNTEEGKLGFKTFMDSMGFIEADEI